MRLMAYDEFLNMSGMFDEAGRRNLVRDRIAARVGYDQADRYAPPPVDRPTDDQKIAELENASLQAGIPQSVTGTELHKDHLLVHMQMMGQLQKMLEAGVINLPQIVAAGEASIAHCSAHLQIMSTDSYRKEEVEFFARELSEAQRVFDQHLSSLQGQMEEERNNMQAQLDEQGQNGNVDPKLEMELHRHDLKMQMMQEQAQVKNEIRAMDAEQRMRIRDLQAAQKIRQKSAQREEDVLAKQQATMRPTGAA
jgi:hypothetical protein